LDIAKERRIVMKSKSLFIITNIITVAIASPCLGLKPEPIHTPPADSKLSFQGEHGELVLNALYEFEKQYEHYREQAKFYEHIDFGVRLLLVVCSFVCALVLGLGRSDKSRKIALGLSILIASIPVLEQQFHVSALHQVSWRTAVDYSRIITDCKETWESLFAYLPENERASNARETVAYYRKKARDLEDREMEISLEPITLSEKMEKYKGKK